LYSTKHKSVIKIIALDLEGTLIASANNPVPRPGLYQFLQWCKKNFKQVVIYTCVDEPIFRSIANKLVINEAVPSWFREIKYVEWDGMIKDLYNIDGIEPEQAIIVDDMEIFISENQKSQWIEIKTFDFPYPEDDNEFIRVANAIREKF
jgi:hypothetical protein